MTPPRKLIKHLAELAKDIREQTQNLYAAGKQELAMEAVCYAEGIERAMVEIAALNPIETHQMEELRSFDLAASRARFAPIPLGLNKRGPKSEHVSIKRGGLKAESEHSGLSQRSSRVRQPQLR